MGQAAGAVADDEGEIEFESVLGLGLANAPEQVLFGDGLLDAHVAEIHIVVRDHGPASADPAVLYDQLNTLNGGCTGACTDVQFAIHLPAGDHDDDNDDDD